MSEGRRGWDAASASSLIKQIPVSQIYKDLLDVLRSLPLTDTQVEELYILIRNRARHKVCVKCGKLKVTIGGTWEYQSLDMSKPKVFICEECK